MKGLGQAALWFGGYLALVFTPLVVLLLAPVPAKGGFWWEAGIGLGFAGLIMMVLQFVLTARLRKPTAPFGIDVIYYFHRYLAYVLLAFLLGHPALLLANDPLLLAALHPASISWSLLSGLLALLLLLALVVTSAWRKRLGLAYNGWRRAHLLLAVAAVALAFAHMAAIGYYSATPAMYALWVVIGFSVLLILLRVRVIRPWRLTRRPWTLSRVEPEQGKSWTLTLEPDGHAGLSFQPGQFAWLSLGHSPFIMEEHPFSIASAPRTDGTLRFTIKALGDFTATVGNIPPGTRACVDGPYGVFSCDRHPHAAGYVFMAGGIGVAPVISMLEALAERGDPRHHVLFAAHSRWDRVPRRDEISALAHRLDLCAVPVLEQPPEDWSGERGWITREILERYLPVNYRDYEYFICGPQAMTKALEHFLHDLGVPMSRVHTELFDMA